jgi:hypothetical protein
MSNIQLIQLGQNGIGYYPTTWALQNGEVLAVSNGSVSLVDPSILLGNIVIGNGNPLYVPTYSITEPTPIFSQSNIIITNADISNVNSISTQTNIFIGQELYGNVMPLNFIDMSYNEPLDTGLAYIPSSNLLALVAGVGGNERDIVIVNSSSGVNHSISIVNQSSNGSLNLASNNTDIYTVEQLNISGNIINVSSGDSISLYQNHDGHSINMNDSGLFITASNNLPLSLFSTDDLNIYSGNLINMTSANSISIYEQYDGHSINMSDVGFNITASNYLPLSLSSAFNGVNVYGFTYIALSEINDGHNIQLDTSGISIIASNSKPININSFDNINLNALQVNLNGTQYVNNMSTFIVNSGTLSINETLDGHFLNMNPSGVQLVANNGKNVIINSNSGNAGIIAGGDGGIIANGNIGFVSNSRIGLSGQTSINLLESTDGHDILLDSTGITIQSSNNLPINLISTNSYINLNSNVVVKMLTPKLSLNINGSTGTSNQVLTSDGLGSAIWSNPSIASTNILSQALRGISQTIPLGTTALLTFNTSNTYGLSEFNTGTNTLTSVSGGLYEFNFYCTFFAGIGNTNTIEFQVNAISMDTLTRLDTGITSISIIYKLNPGDVFQIIGNRLIGGLTINMKTLTVKKIQ